MLTLADLWLPILLSAIIVWIASSIIWMLMPWHRGDWHGLPNEEAARGALKGTPPGQYMVPYCSSHKDMKNPEHVRKLTEGPVAFLTVLPSRKPGMGTQMVLWFLCAVLISLLVAYVVSRTRAAGTEYLEVFRVAGVVAWLAYGGASLQESIWFGRSWRMTSGMLLDGLVYGLLTAGVFGWLWPAAS